MKKKVMRIIYVLCACCAVFVFTASAQTAFINKPSSATVTSSPVGLAKSATYFASAYNFSPSTVTARCQAAFAGSVYSTEASFTLKADVYKRQASGRDGPHPGDRRPAEHPGELHPPGLVGPGNRGAGAGAGSVSAPGPALAAGMGKGILKQWHTTFKINASPA